MRRRFTLSCFAAVTLLVTGCASNDEWDTWKGRSAHFASTDHAAFSVRNRLGTAPRVSRKDIEIARQQGWWGQPVTVDQAQILER